MSLHHHHHLLLLLLLLLTPSLFLSFWGITFTASRFASYWAARKQKEELIIIPPSLPSPLLLTCHNLRGRLRSPSTAGRSRHRLLRHSRNARARRIRAVHPHVVVPAVVIVPVPATLAPAAVVVATVVIILVVAIPALVVIAPVEVAARIVVVVVATSAAIAHATAAPGRRHAKRLAVQLAFLAPVDARLTLAVRLRLARNVVEERLGLVVAVLPAVILGLLLPGARLIARVVLLLQRIDGTVYLGAQRKNSFRSV